ncbi:MAG: ATP-binding protein [Bacteroidetes bacterium]|nr:MAG: ATP-binding protein [Bacteroidota bacterium]
MASITHKLTIPSSTRYLVEVRDFVKGHAAKAGFSSQAIEYLKLAVDEACTNVIKHAYKDDRENIVDVAIIVTDDKFVIRLRDRGIAFNEAEYQLPDLKESISEGKRGGLGVKLMNRLMDRVEYRTHDGVNECCLVKYREDNS